VTAKLCPENRRRGGLTSAGLRKREGVFKDGNHGAQTSASPLKRKSSGGETRARKRSKKIDKRAFRRCRWFMGASGRETWQRSHRESEREKVQKKKKGPKKSDEPTKKEVWGGGPREVRTSEKARRWPGRKPTLEGGEKTGEVPRRGATELSTPCRVQEKESTFPRKKSIDGNFLGGGGC